MINDEQLTEKEYKKINDERLTEKINELNRKE